MTSQMRRSLQIGTRQQIILTNGSGVPERELNRLRYRDLVIVVNGTEAPFVSKEIGAPLSGVIQIELVEMSVSGVPLTAGVPDYDYLAVKLANMGYDSAWTSSGNQGLILWNSGERTTHRYTDRVLTQSETPSTFREVQITLSKPDGTNATSSDFSTLVVVLRLTYDLDVRRVY